jgi:glycosyltransferase involved in cell wall biosynthesis
MALGGECCRVSGPGQLRLSALVVVRDEERQLAECLAGLGFADELVVVLDRCRDGSAEIARRFTDRLVDGAWEREGLRRRAGIAACRGDWILEIDADERVTLSLAAEIARVVVDSPDAWHLIPVDNYIGTRLVRRGWGASFGRSSHAALFRKGAKEWGDQRVHPAVTLSGTEGARLSAAIVHFVDRDISAMLRRLDRYSSLRAQDLRASGDIGSYGRNLRRILSRFLKCYVARRGYREGPYGFLIALCAALYPLLSYLKARLEPEPSEQTEAQAKVDYGREPAASAAVLAGVIATRVERADETSGDERNGRMPMCR